MPDASPQAFLSLDLHCGTGFYLKTLDFVDPQEIILFMLSDQGDHVCCHESCEEVEVLCCCGQCANINAFKIQLCCCCIPTKLPSRLKKAVMQKVTEHVYQHYTCLPFEGSHIFDE